MINGFGGAALDTIHHISHWPEADNTCYIKESKVEPGGMVLGALIAASRLGAAVMYSGALGDDKEGLILQEYMNRNRIDTGCCSILKGEQTPVSQIMTDPEGRRTIFHNKGLRSSDYHVELNSQLLDSTDILLLDGSWIENALCMAEKALKKYIPIILDLSPNNTHPLRDDLIRSSDYPILSEILAARISGTEDNSEQALVLQKRFGRTIIITAGNRGVFRADGSKRVRHSPAFKVKTVDTTGAGDTFHGAFAAALLEGLDLDESIRFAMGTAALKCTNRGWDHLPESKTVRTFIEQESNNE